MRLLRWFWWPYQQAFKPAAGGVIGRFVVLRVFIGLVTRPALVLFAVGVVLLNVLSLSEQTSDQIGGAVAGILMLTTAAGWLALIGRGVKQRVRRPGSDHKLPNLDGRTPQEEDVTTSVEAVSPTPSRDPIQVRLVRWFEDSDNLWIVRWYFRSSVHALVGSYRWESHARSPAGLMMGLVTKWATLLFALLYLWDFTEARFPESVDLVTAIGGSLAAAHSLIHVIPMVAVLLRIIGGSGASHPQPRSPSLDSGDEIPASEGQQTQAPSGEDFGRWPDAPSEPRQEETTVEEVKREEESLQRGCLNFFLVMVFLAILVLGGCMLLMEYT
ncbi:MAG: hypothetical protein VX584_02485 [Actinomycetota bacterium]|nr:hypothetical protein [Actinomycetota bacterium]MEC9473531.1 hypothetical protein [Actinomycetota bacterium]